MGAAMKLTDLEIKKKAKPADSGVVRLPDELGLYLEVSPGGVKSWRLRVRSKGANTIKTIGHYPAMSLAKARDMRDALRRNDPSVTPPPPPAPTFEEVALEWHGVYRSRWKAKHAANVLSSLKREIFPFIGSDPVDTIKAPAIKKLLTAFEATPSVPSRMNVAHDVRQRIEAVFRFAVASGLCENNPASSMRDVISPLPVAVPRPAATTLEAARAVLVAVDSTPGYPLTRLAMRLLALTALRNGELRGAKWDEFEGLDGDLPVWRVPAERMKMKREHIVPLAPQAVEVIEEIRKLSGNMDFVFPSLSDIRKPMSENALGYLLNRAGYHGRHVPHGWRSSFSTIMNGRRRQDRQIIDLMIAHKNKDDIEAAYNRQEFAAERREIACEWANILLEGMPPASALAVLPKRKYGAWETAA
jgi:integrase